MAKHTMDELKQWQSLPLGAKVGMTRERIRGWVKAYGEDGCYVSFSGGKDSTVLLHIVREVCGYDIPAVFVDTGLEYPEIREFVKKFDNVTIVRPIMNFRKVIDTYGYPFFSKEVSNCVAGARKYLRSLQELESLDRQTDRQTIPYACYMADLVGIDRRQNKENKKYKELQKGNIPSGSLYRLKRLKGELEKNGEPSQFNQVKYNFMLDAPFEISDQCCDVMKKAPAHKYEKETGRFPIIATMCEESNLRTGKWLQYGCNAFDAKQPVSKPMSFWTEQDVYQYILENNLEIASVYGDIVDDYSAAGQCEGQLDFINKQYPKKTTGCHRTGCMFCGFGCHLEKPGEGRFERMKQTHPKQYDYIMRPKEQGGLNYKEIIDWLNEHGKMNIRY